MKLQNTRHFSKIYHKTQPQTWLNQEEKKLPLRIRRLRISNRNHQKYLNSPIEKQKFHQSHKFIHQSNSIKADRSSAHTLKKTMNRRVTHK